MDKCSFLPHAAHSLLCGRPLVVYAKSANMDAAREIVTALWVFVPGQAREHLEVVPWEKRNPLALVDLHRVRLMGLSKQVSNGIPRVVQRYVSVLDLEAGTLVAPRYLGSIIGSLLQSRGMCDSEALLLAHVHCTLLGAAKRAFRYYHRVLIRPPPEQSEAEAEAEFFRQHEAPAGDRRIIAALAHVVRCQLVAEFAKLCGKVDRFAPFPTISLDSTPCTHFHNAGPPLCAET